MLSIVVGMIFILAGGWGLWFWFPELLLVLRGSVPAILVMGGVLAVIAGASVLKEDLPPEPPEERSKN